MTSPLGAGSRPATLAEVIPLVRSRTRGATDASPAQDSASAVDTAREAMAGHIDLLQRRCGDRWPELPTTLGREVAAAEALLVQGPTRLDPLTVSPADAVDRAQPLIRAAQALADQAVEEAEVLGEALNAEIAGLPLRHLDRVVGAVLVLGTVPRVEPTWSSPYTADGAHVILNAHGAELRATTKLHRELYADFTDSVLDIPEARLRAGRRSWRLLARGKLRQDLASASRTGRVPGALGAVANHVLDVHEARRRLTSLAPLLTAHLGRGGWGPLVDVDALASSLAAVRQLQRALGDRLDKVRLGTLLAADAFRSAELVAPASNLRTMFQRWRVLVVSVCGGDPWVTPADKLAPWAVRVAAAMPAITTGMAAMTEIGRPPATVRNLVDDLLLRERVAELDEWLHACDGSHRATRRADSGSAC